MAAGVFAAKNIFEGNGDISIAPVIGGAVNANGEFVPEISLATKVSARERELVEGDKDKVVLN